MRRRRWYPLTKEMLRRMAREQPVAVIRPRQMLLFVEPVSFPASIQKLLDKLGG